MIRHRIFYIGEDMGEAMRKFIPTITSKIINIEQDRFFKNFFTVLYYENEEGWIENNSGELPPLDVEKSTKTLRRSIDVSLKIIMSKENPSEIIADKCYYDFDKQSWCIYYEGDYYSSFFNFVALSWKA